MFRNLRSLSLALCFAAALPAADPVRMLIVAGSGTILDDAKSAFDKRYGPGLAELDTTATPESFARAKIIFLFHPDPEFSRRVTPDILKAKKRGATILVAPDSLIPNAWGFKPNPSLNRTAESYWQYGGVENVASLIAFLYKSAGGQKPLTLPAPVSLLERGIYHPKATREFTKLSDYLEWYRAQKFVPAGAPLIGITFYNAYMRQRDVAHIDALVAELEKNGIGAVPAFGWPFHTLDPLLTIDGQSPLRLIFGLNLGIIRPDDIKWLERQGVHTMNLQVTRESHAEWASGWRGLPIDKVSSQVNTPERTGSTEPLLIASAESKPGSETAVTTPIPERISMAVRRAKRWITLQDKPNSEKKLVFVYYNNPPGKGNLGASYLQILPSMATMLRRLEQEGYRVGTPNDKQLLQILERSGRNVEAWAPGELEAMVESGGLVLWPVEEYKRYFAQLPKEFRDFVTRDYGPPEQARMLRVKTTEGKHFFVIPGARYGNVFLSVQPLRSTFDRVTAITHDTRIPVPHSYVAAYLWYRHVYKADAVLHIGRHGTLEWLPGKQVMQAPHDHSEAMLDDMPNPYLYITDGGGEALQALRRSAAVVMSHLTPLIVSSGITPEFQPIKRSIDQLYATQDTKPDLAAEYQKEVLAEIRKLKLDQQLGMNADSTPWEELRNRVKKFLDDMEDGPIPAGIHALGELPPEKVQRESLAEFLKFGFQDSEVALVRGELAAWADAIYEGRTPEIQGKYTPALRDRIQTQWAQGKTWIDNVRASQQLEVDAIPRVLAGKYLPAAPIGDPLRVPAGLPTGRNLYGFDPSLVPTKAAYALGRKMADETIARFRKENNGKFPERVSMMLWYDETESHHGAMESMALHLMGVEPQWNSRAQVDNLRLIPDAEMKHPRVNVLVNVSGIYRDGFGDKMLLLDRAARLAASAGDNAISRQDKEVKAALIAQGVDEKRAGEIARARVFGNQPGAYSIGVDRLVEQSKNAGNTNVANLYLHYMNFAFSNEIWGETAPKALEQHFKGNQTVLFSRTSNLYGALDNDDMYSYAGGMTFASKTVNGGQAPSFYLHNLRKRGSENMVDLKTFLATELNQRAWNPKWIDNMKRSGYAGAREMNREVEHLYGFQATTEEQMDGTFWQNTYDVYVADKHGMELDKFFDKENAHARQGILARLLEVDRQGAYQFSEADRQTIVKEYIRSVNRSGVACSANTCGNQKLQAYAASIAPLISGLGRAELQKFGQTLAKATRWNPQQFAGAPAAFRAGVSAAQRPPAAAKPGPPPPPGPPIVSGRVMKEKVIRLANEAGAAALPFAWSWISVLLLIIASGSWWESRNYRRGT
ncbi:MAG: cobaltochelatase subunit CobN [Bryobacter sp.]|nr:cobaltochelatase subunit CobN [Bryobacter sp.]